MTYRHRVSEWLSDEAGLQYQGHTVLVDYTQWSNVPPSPERSEFCGTTPDYHGVCDMLCREGRQR
jgi:hypothetical protein